MMIVPAGVKVHLALGYTDMRKGMDGLAMLVQGALKKDPFCGHLFAFRGKRAQIVKILFWDGTGPCLFTKRLDQGGFVWPRMAGFEGSITLSPARSRARLKTGEGRINIRKFLLQMERSRFFESACSGRFGHAVRS